MNDIKSELEKKVLEGLGGRPELKAGEKARYLGEFRERVIKALTVSQVEEPGVYPEIMQALRDPRANKLVLRRDVNLDRAKDYLELAKEQQITFKRVHSPNLKGDIGLVVVSASALDEPNVLVQNRKERLVNLGLPEEIINSVGSKICDKCWRKIESLCPEELVNYKRISWLESITGVKCISCTGKK